MEQKSGQFKIISSFMKKNLVSAIESVQFASLIMQIFCLKLLLFLSWTFAYAKLSHNTIRADNRIPSHHQIAKSQIAYKVHETVITLQLDSEYAALYNHRDEKNRLLARLDKSSGSWNKHHPRYRLLQALHGFRRYKERNLAELDRWRGLYKHVSSAHKKVCERQD